MAQNNLSHTSYMLYMCIEVARVSLFSGRPSKEDKKTSHRMGEIVQAAYLVTAYILEYINNSQNSILKNTISR